MPSISVTIKQTEDILDEILRIIRHESENLNPVLSEPDQNSFVEEEERLRERVRETARLESMSWSFQSLLGLPSPQAVKCLKEAGDLRQRVKEDINAAVRKRTSGRGNPPATSFFDFMGMRSPEDTGSPPADRMSELYLEPRFQNESNPGSDSPRHSHYVGRPASSFLQSPRQSGTLRSPSNSPFRSSAQLPLDPVFVSPVTQDVNTITPSMGRQAYGQQGSRNGDDDIFKTNCVDINSSSVTGLTLNNGGTQNSGAVIHTTTLPPQRSPHVPHL